MQQHSLVLGKYLVVLTFSALLSACGGGSSDRQDSITTGEANSPSSSSIASSANSSANSSASSSEDSAATAGNSSNSSAASSEQVLASDSFTAGTSRWKIEQESSSGSITAADGILDIIEPAGATLWFSHKFSGDYEIRFTTTPIPYSVTVGSRTYTDRISDLNVFWNATVPEATGPDHIHLGYAVVLESYNALHLYYVGFGANCNTTTRLRRYDGTSARPQITGYASSASRTAAQPMIPQAT